MAFDGWPRGAGGWEEQCSPASPPFPQDLRRHCRRYPLCAPRHRWRHPPCAPQDRWCDSFVRLYFGWAHIAFEHITLFQDSSVWLYFGRAHNVFKHITLVKDITQ